jgi:hypothetical protein
MNCPMPFAVNGSTTEPARETLNGSRCGPTLSLSPEERAGVRASVLLLLTSLCLLLFCSPALALEMRPAYLELRQTG